MYGPIQKGKSQTMRHKFYEYEYFNDSTKKIIDKSIKLFLGQIIGIAIHKRGIEDNHLCISIIKQDDEYWFGEYNSMCSSSYWLEEYIELLMAAKEWLQNNAEQDLQEETGRIYGWKMKC